MLLQTHVPSKLIYSVTKQEIIAVGGSWSLLVPILPDCDYRIQRRVLSFLHTFCPVAAYDPPIHLSMYGERSKAPYPKTLTNSIPHLTQGEKRTVNIYRVHDCTLAIQRMSASQRSGKYLKMITSQGHLVQPLSL